MEALRVIPEQFAMDHLHLLRPVRVVEPLAKLLNGEVGGLRAEVQGSLEATVNVVALWELVR